MYFPHNVDFFHTSQRPANHPIAINCSISPHILVFQYTFITGKPPNTIESINCKRSVDTYAHPYRQLLNNVKTSLFPTGCTSLTLDGHPGPNYTSNLTVNNKIPVAINHGVKFTINLQTASQDFGECIKYPHLNVDSTSRKYYSSFSKPRLSNLKKRFYLI